ncbi:MAG: hypothetical protein IJ890_04795 [Clostridia bacterium]|nr:hypothetical protein [Clostridia bacterium]
MLKNKYLKILIIVFCIIFVIMSVTAIITAGNTIHTEHCEVEHCPICSLIHIATGVIRNIELVVFNVFILIAIVPLVQLIEKIMKQIIKQTLVKLKVVQIK